MVVNLYEFSQPIREPFRPPLTEVRHDILYEAISIFLLVQRINQISAKVLIPAATDPVFLLAFFFGLLSKPFYSCSLLAKIFPHVSHVLFFSIIFQSLPRCAFFSTISCHCHLVNGLSPFALRDSL